MIGEEEYAVRYVELPYKVEGMTVCDEDGFYNIYINSLLPPEVQSEALKHEMTHIEENDFYNDKTIEECESIANQSKRRIL